MKYKLLVRDEMNDYNLLEDLNGDIVIEVSREVIEKKRPRLYLDAKDREKCRSFGGEFLRDLASDIIQCPERYKDRIF